MVKALAKDIMTTGVKTVLDEAKLSEVARVLADNHISGVPVVDKAGTLVGIISEADLMNDDKRRSAIPRMALFGLHLVPDRLLKDSYDEGFALSVRDIMSRHVVTAEEDTPLDELAGRMVNKRINRIPILRDGKLVGIVTRGDILRGMRPESAK